MKPTYVVSSCFDLSNEPVTSTFQNFQISKFIQIHIQTSFDHNLGFVTRIWLILFANRSFWPKVSDKTKSTKFWYCYKLFSVARVNCLFLKFFKIFCSNFMLECLCMQLLALDRLNGVWRIELSGIMSANHLHQQYKASSHFDHIFHPQFLCISFNPQTLRE